MTLKQECSYIYYNYNMDLNKRPVLFFLRSRITRQSSETRWTSGDCSHWTTGKSSNVRPARRPTQRECCVQMERNIGKYGEISARGIVTTGNLRDPFFFVTGEKLPTFALVTKKIFAKFIVKLIALYTRRAVRSSRRNRISRIEKAIFE